MEIANNMIALDTTVLNWNQQIAGFSENSFTSFNENP